MSFPTDCYSCGCLTLQPILLILIRPSLYVGFSCRSSIWSCLRLFITTPDVVNFYFIVIVWMLYVVPAVFLWLFVNSSHVVSADVTHVMWCCSFLNNCMKVAYLVYLLALACFSVHPMFFFFFSSSLDECCLCRSSRCLFAWLFVTSFHVSHFPEGLYIFPADDYSCSCSSLHLMLLLFIFTVDRIIHCYNHSFVLWF